MVTMNTTLGVVPLTVSSSSSSSDFSSTAAAITEPTQFEMNRSPNTSPVSSPKSSFVKVPPTVPMNDIHTGNTSCVTNSRKSPTKRKRLSALARKRRNMESELNELLEDSSRCDPRFSPTLPTSYLKSHPTTSQTQLSKVDVSSRSFKGKNGNDHNNNNNSNNNNINGASPNVASKDKRNSISHFNSLEDFLTNGNNRNGRKTLKNAVRRRDSAGDAGTHGVEKIRITDLLNPILPSSAPSTNIGKGHTISPNIGPNTNSFASENIPSPSDENVKRFTKKTRLVRCDARMRAAPSLEDILDHVEIPAPVTSNAQQRERDKQIKKIPVRSTAPTLEDILNGTNGPETLRQTTSTNVDEKHNRPLSRATSKGVSKARRNSRIIHNIKSEDKSGVPNNTNNNIGNDKGPPVIKRKRGRPRKIIQKPIPDNNDVKTESKIKAEASNNQQFKIEGNPDRKSVKEGPIKPMESQNPDGDLQKQTTRRESLGIESPRIERRGRKRKRPLEDGGSIGPGNDVTRVNGMGTELPGPKHLKVERRGRKKKAVKDGITSASGSTMLESSSKDKVLGTESPRVERRGRKRKRPLENGGSKEPGDDVTHVNGMGTELPGPKHLKIERRGRKKKIINDSIPDACGNTMLESSSKNKVLGTEPLKVERRGRKKKIINGNSANSDSAVKSTPREDLSPTVDKPKVERRGRKKKEKAMMDDTKALRLAGEGESRPASKDEKIHSTLHSNRETKTSLNKIRNGQENCWVENKRGVRLARLSRLRDYRGLQPDDEDCREPEIKTHGGADTPKDSSEVKFSDNEMERERSTFLNWATPKLRLDHKFFDIDSISASNIFFGDPLRSIALEGHTWRRNPRAKLGPKIVKLQSVLYMNYQEEYFVDFSADNSRYNPMAEIGKLVEYSALVYLPDPYAQQLKDDLIPALNYAYDTSDTDLFISEVERYNAFIRRIPRYKIIEHLKTVREIPTTFIHNFLHIVYTRSIHPSAKKLKHYKAFSNFVYGELLPTFLTDLFNQCQLRENQVFMDLGSGVGNCVIQAALEHGCRISLGCEIMPMASELTELQMIELKQRCRLMGLTLPPVEFRLRESFVNNPRINELITQCDVLLVNNFLFDSKLNQEVEKILQHAKIGCKIISLKNLRNFGYTIDFFDVENILNRLKVEEHEFGENSVSWTHTGGRYYISTVLDDVDETLFSLNARFRHSKRRVKYTD